MKINSVINRYSDPTSGGRLNETPAAGAIQPLEGFEPVFEAGDAKAQALREILDEYDITDITPREFSQMLQQMHKEGLISDDLFGQLSLIRGELDRDGIEADESIDLVAFFEKKLVEMRLDSMFTLGKNNVSDADSETKNNAERLAWVRKIAAAQESADMVGLNAVA